MSGASSQPCPVHGRGPRGIRDGISWPTTDRASTDYDLNLSVSVESGETRQRGHASAGTVEFDVES